MDSGRPLFSMHSALIGSSVRVYFSHDRTFASGVLYAIDPESGDVALLQPTSTTPDGVVPVKIIMGHAIDKMALDETGDCITLASMRSAVASPITTQELNTAAVDATELTRRLKSFLDERFIPHTPGPRDVVSVFGGAATLRFPFNANCVNCANEQILRRLQMLLDDFQRDNAQK